MSRRPFVILDTSSHAALNDFPSAISDKSSPTALDMPSPLILAHQLLTWFAAQKRDLPWRDAPCGQRDPYRVWLAEIMLQQTVAAAVRPYYRAFLDAWPTVKALATATDDEVMRAWAGLGYYARARNMLKCARFINEKCQGVFPRDESDLLKLPGIGPYTAAAVSAMAFQGPSAPVDGNVIRTFSRLYGVGAVMPQNKAIIQGLATAMVPKGKSGDFAEALMDLGAMVCRPKVPNCAACPWETSCWAHGVGEESSYPKKAYKKPKPTRRGWAFWIENERGDVLLERRPDRGLLGGMMGLPTPDWAESLPSAGEAVISFLPLVLSISLHDGQNDNLRWHALKGVIKHTFTHFHLELGVICVRVQEDFFIKNGCKNGGAGNRTWIAPCDIDVQALPTVMRKAIVHARTGEKKKGV